MLNALKPPTRSLKLSDKQSADGVKERRLIDTVRNRPARSLSQAERTEISQLALTKPRIDLEITFEYNSDQVRPAAREPLNRLGRTLSNEQLKGYVFLINGHTAGVGGDTFNKDLSERRAEAVKRILIQEFGLPADKLVAVGFGKNQLKNTVDPAAAENRRVQVVNTEVK